MFIIDIETGVTRQLGEVNASCAVFSVDGTHLLIGTGGDVQVWNILEAQMVESWKGHEETIIQMVLSENGTRILTCGRDLTARLWDKSSTQQLLSLRGFKGDLECVAMSPTGEQIATASDGMTIWVWDAPRKDIP